MALQTVHLYGHPTLAHAGPHPKEGLDPPPALQPFVEAPQLTTCSHMTGVTFFQQMLTCHLSQYTGRAP
jgi:hypothetical protein